MTTNFIDEKKINESLKGARPPDKIELREILAQAREMKGIGTDAVGKLLTIEDPESLQSVFDTALFVKNEIYGRRLVLFAPLYVTNLCQNECLYCAFRRSNSFITRHTLEMEDVRRETEALVAQGQKRILLVSGEGLGESALPYSLKAIETVYSVKQGNGEIRRVNINIAPLSVDGFKLLKQAKIGTYQLFQETYHYDTFRKMHPEGPKSDYLYHLTAMDRAMEGGIDDVGIGILFGLYDYRFEILALLQHIRHLEQQFGVGPHTISVPRLEPAVGSEISIRPPFPVSDHDFKKIISILRITVPYTGMILSTRENASMRHEAVSLGISQISAGSRTNPGGYTETGSGEQFSLGDHRPLEEVIADIVRLGFIPSFCTGCYRAGRTGADFMDLAKPGLIKNFCLPNALTTFQEYLADYAGARTKQDGERLIAQMVAAIPDEQTRRQTVDFLEKIKSGIRDLYF